MQVNCVATRCYPKRLRWANNNSQAEATGYGISFDSDVFGAKFLSNLVQSTGRQSELDRDTLVDYQYIQSSLVNDSYWFTYGPTEDHATQNPPWNVLTEDPMSTSLSEGLNTYYTLSQIVVAQKIEPDFNTLLLGDQTHEDGFFKIVDARGGPPYEQAYRKYWQWIPISFAACCILLAAAVGSCWLRVNTLAPDIFGFVSSLTRGNPRIQPPTEGPTLSGIERARTLKKVKVKLGVVQEVTADNGSVGKIGLAPVQTGIQSLRPAHVYQ